MSRRTRNIQCRFVLFSISIFSKLTCFCSHHICSVILGVRVLEKEFQHYLGYTLLCAPTWSDNSLLVCDFSRQLLLAVLISIASLPRTGAVQVDPIGMISKRGGSCKMVSYSDNASTSLSVKRMRLMNLAYPLTHLHTYLHTYLYTYLHSYMLGLSTSSL